MRRIDYLADLGIPEGYEKLRATEVWTNGARLVILGNPPDEDEYNSDSEYGHDCDVMGCGSFGPHVIAIGEYLYGDEERRAGSGVMDTKEAEAAIKCIQAQNALAEQLSQQLQDAREEIERLEGENARQRGVWDALAEMTIDRNILQTEIKRLREALDGLKHDDGCYCEAAFGQNDGSHPRHSEECENACDTLEATE